MAIVRAVPLMDVAVVVAVSFTLFVPNAMFVSAVVSVVAVAITIMVIIAVMPVFVVAIMAVVIMILRENERGRKSECDQCGSTAPKPEPQ